MHGNRENNFTTKIIPSSLVFFFFILPEHLIMRSVQNSKFWFLPHSIIMVGWFCLKYLMATDVGKIRFELTWDTFW